MININKQLIIAICGIQIFLNLYNAKRASWNGISELAAFLSLILYIDKFEKDIFVEGLESIRCRKGDKAAVPSILRIVNQYEVKSKKKQYAQ